MFRFKMPFMFTPKRAGGNTGHQVLVARDVERCDQTDFLEVELQSKDAD